MDGAGEFLLSVAGLAFVAAGLALVGERIIAGTKRAGVRLRDDAIDFEPDAEPIGGSPRWVKAMRESEGQ